MLRWTKQPCCKCKTFLGFQATKLPEPKHAESLSAIGGYTYGYSSVDDPEATYAQKVSTGLAYGLAAAAGTKGLKAVDNRFNQNAITDVISRGVIDGYKLDDSYLLVRQEFRKDKNDLSLKLFQYRYAFQFANYLVHTPIPIHILHKQTVDRTH